MTKTLDKIDEMMINLLRVNARTPLVTLAKKVGLSRSAAQERLTRLEQSGVIAGYTIRYGAAHNRAMYAWLMLKFKAGHACAQVVPKLLQNIEIRLCNSLVGPVDLLILVEAASAEALYEVRERIAAIEGVADLQTAPVLTIHFDGRGAMTG